MFYGSAALLLLVLPLAGLNGQLEFQRQAVLAGQWWRLLSAHFVHLNLLHAGGNVLALLLAWSLLRVRRPVVVDLLVTGLLGVLISLALLFWSPQVTWYIGASGMVHGLVVWWSLMRGARSKTTALIAVVLVLSKVSWEQSAWYDGTAVAALIGAPVIVDAHMYGAIAGLLIGLVRAAALWPDTRGQGGTS